LKFKPSSAQIILLYDDHVMTLFYKQKQPYIHTDVFKASIHANQSFLV